MKPEDQVIFDKLKQHPDVHMMLRLSISGSHLYGINGPKSDIDYRGTFLWDTRLVCGLGKFGYDYTQRPGYGKLPDVIEFKENDDIVLYELSKEIGLAIGGNCNVLEQYKTDSLYITKDMQEIIPIILECYDIYGLVASYRGMAYQNYKKFLEGNSAIAAKKWLYVFRSLLAGKHVLETGEIEPNLRKLNEKYQLKYIDELIKIKLDPEYTSPYLTINQGLLDREVHRMMDEIDEAIKNININQKEREQKILEVNQHIQNIRIKEIFEE